MVTQASSTLSIPQLQYETCTNPALWQTPPYIVILEHLENGNETTFFAYICHLKVQHETAEGICNAIEEALVDQEYLPQDRLAFVGSVSKIVTELRRIILADGNEISYRHLIILSLQNENYHHPIGDNQDQSSIHNWGLKALRQSLKIQEEISSHPILLSESAGNLPTLQTHQYKVLPEYGITIPLPYTSLSSEENPPSLQKYKWYLYL
jgi:hypothetical protein